MIYIKPAFMTLYIPGPRDLKAPKLTRSGLLTPRFLSGIIHYQNLLEPPMVYQWQRQTTWVSQPYRKKFRVSRSQSVGSEKYLFNATGREDEMHSFPRLCVTLWVPFKFSDSFRSPGFSGSCSAIGCCHLPSITFLVPHQSHS